MRALIANLTESRWVKAQANWTLPYLEKLIKAAEATNFAKSVKSVNQQLRDDCKRWQKKLSKVTRASAGDEPDEFYGAFLKFFQALAGAFRPVREPALTSEREEKAGTGRVVNGGHHVVSYDYCTGGAPLI